MDSRTTEYLVHDISNGLQHICSGRKELISYAKQIDCCINKNKLARVKCSQLATDGEMIITSHKTHKKYYIEELFK